MFNKNIKKLNKKQNKSLKFCSLHGVLHFLKSETSFLKKLLSIGKMDNFRAEVKPLPGLTRFYKVWSQPSLFRHLNPNISLEF